MLWSRGSGSSPHKPAQTKRGSEIMERRSAALARHLLSPGNEDDELSSSRLRHLLASPCSGWTRERGVAVIVGAMALDIHAVPSSGMLQSGTTTPGSVQYVRGGVARNVAECMAKLGTSPFLISVIGDDMAGDMLLTHWQSLGLSVEGIRQCSGVATPVVAAVLDNKGELAAAVADTHAVEEQLTPEWIVKFGAIISSASILMLDANMSSAALEAACELAEKATVPVWFEPVSMAKCVKFKAIAHHVTFTSPNELELVAMANSLSLKKENLFSLNSLLEGNNRTTIDDVVRYLRPDVLLLLESGVKNVALTLGKHGIVLCSREPRRLPKLLLMGQTTDNQMNPLKLSLVAAPSYVLCKENVLGRHQNQKNHNQSLSVHTFYIHLPALPACIVNLSGAGDCFVAGVLAAFCMHKDVCSSMAYGVAAARQAVQSELNVPLQMPQDVLTDDAGLVLAAAKELFGS